jgi:rhodanese-related sulfurtransferase
MLQIHTVEKEEVYDKLDNPNVQIINVLGSESANLGMIKGTRRIPLVELDTRARELDKEREVITYCASYQCDASRKAAERLADMGFNVKAYEGGLKEWRESVLPMD